jgi:hypothetical protein
MARVVLGGLTGPPIRQVTDGVARLLIGHAAKVSAVCRAWRQRMVDEATGPNAWHYQVGL